MEVLLRRSERDPRKELLPADSAEVVRDRMGSGRRPVREPVLLPVREMEPVLLPVLDMGVSGLRSALDKERILRESEFRRESSGDAGDRPSAIEARERIPDTFGDVE